MYIDIFNAAKTSVSHVHGENANVTVRFVLIGLFLE